MNEIICFDIQNLILRSWEFRETIVNRMFILFIMIAVWNIVFIAYFIYEIKIEDNNLKYIGIFQLFCYFYSENKI